MAGYAGRVRADIERWVFTGLIDRATADRLVADVEKHSGKSFSFGNVLAVMAAILLGASVLIFVAANWEAIPRLVRVLSLFALISVSYVGGALLKQRGSGFGEALYLLGAAAFGASIALIGQMYHFTGDESQAVLVWCFGTMLAAAGLRSPILTNAAVALAATWLWMRGFEWNAVKDFPHGFLLVGAVIWAISYWTESAAARHLLLLCVILYAMLFGISYGLAETGIALALLSTAVFLAAHFAHDTVERFAKLGGPYPAHSLVGFLVGMSMVQASVFDEFGPMLLATLVAFSGIVAALLMRGRQSALMRWIAYIAFSIELCFLYVVTLGTMISTAGLFLFSGMALAIVAYIIMRIERRLGAKPAAEGGAA
jgi:uncharacterized membrane protein